MTIHQFLLLAILAELASACSPLAMSTECNGLSNQQAVKMARERKRGLLNNSVRSEQKNFASDVATVAKDPTGYAAKVSFAGKDGRQLVALIEKDCYVGWTQHDR